MGIGSNKVHRESSSTLAVGAYPTLGKPRPMRDKPAPMISAQTPTAPGMSARIPALGDFRRIVVKVGSSLLVDREGGRLYDAWLAALADDIAWLHGEKRDVLVVSSGAISLGRAVLKLPPGPLKLEDSQAAAAVGQIALARTWSEVLGRRGITAGQVLVTLAGHRGAPALSQRPLDHREAARMARRAGDQRERHRRHQRDPLRRQRPARRAGRHHGERRPAGAAVRHRRPLRRAARRRPRGQARAGDRAHHAGDRGDGGRGRLRALARRHADQDRGRQDRHHRRHPHGDRVGPRRRIRCAPSPTARAAAGSSRRPIRSPRARSGSPARSSRAARS